MVLDDLWESARMNKGFLCIGCLEKRIGRKLKPNDFIDSRINRPSPWDTPRLRARKDGGPEKQPATAVAQPRAE